MASINYVPTTILLDPDLLKGLKRYAAESKQSVSAVIRKQLSKLITKKAAPLPGSDLLKLFGTVSLPPSTKIDIDNIHEYDMDFKEI